MITKSDIVAELKRYAEGLAPETGLAEAALLMGALDRPALPLARYHRHLEKLAGQVGDYARIKDGTVPVAVMVEALRQVLSRHYGYGGGDTEGADEDCFDMTRIIDARIGASEGLSILYAETARRLGWAAELVQIPGRMLVRLESLGERMIVDPLGDGCTLDPAAIRSMVKAYGGNEAELTPDGLKVLNDTEALLRLLAGKKSYLLRNKRLEEVAQLLQRALLIAPEEPTLWRECGLLNARLDRIQAAVDALEEYLRLGAGDSARYNTTILLQELRGRLT